MDIAVVSGISMEDFELVILCGGGSSSERNISLLSGENVFQHCKNAFRTRKIILERDELPDEVKKCGKNSVIFPLTHGEFGESGELQKMMEDCGLTFIGSDSKTSKLCMDKERTKQVVSNVGVPIIDGFKFKKNFLEDPSDILSKFGDKLFIKPNAKGSSIDVHPISSSKDFINVINSLDGDTEYLLEKKVFGYDVTVCLLNGKTLEIVKIRPKHEFFSYEDKYTAGMADEICPADIPDDMRRKVSNYAEVAYKACGCRDLARADFVLTDDGDVYFLELNTLPGMTPVSLYPKSCFAAGLSIESLTKILISSALSRRDNAKQFVMQEAEVFV